jgi:hypothetical protein
MGTAGLRRYTGAMNPLRAALLVLACALPLAATAQWQWIDKDGRKVFSDRPPPPDVPAKNILKQPGAKLQAEATAPVPAAQAPANTASGLKISGKDKELEAKKKQAEAAEADRQKAEEEKVAKARADNCERARRAKASFDTGLRVAQVNAKGEREFLDDKARAAEAKRLQGIIEADCKTS